MENRPFFRASLEEGERIGNLALELSKDIDGDRISCIGSLDHQELIAAIFFSRLYFSEPAKVYMLAPVGVSTPFQGRGLGTSLINWGLSHIIQHSSFIVTYGDPAYYSRFGFKRISEEQVRAPHTLSLPHGWLGLKIDNCEIPALKSKPKCVEQFNDPRLW